MARHRKFPQPHTNEEIPYDSEGFINWCVDNQGKAVSSAKKYADDIKTAYLTIFEDDDRLFDNLKEAFTPRPSLDPNHPMETLYNRLLYKWPDMEDEYDNIFDYLYEIENIDEYGPIMIKTSDGGEAPLPKEDWLRAFRAYVKYLRWKINDVYIHNYLPVEASLQKWEEWLSLPLEKEFSAYLKSIHPKPNPEWIKRQRDKREEGKSKRIVENTYQGENGSYTYISRLTKIYNLLLTQYTVRRVAENLDRILRMKIPIWEHCDILFKRIDNARECASAEILSDSDIAGGKTALRRYMDFMKSYSKNPDAYQPNKFNRTKRLHTN